MGKETQVKLLYVVPVVLIGLSLGACCLPFSAGVTVNVSNEGTEPISNLKLTFKGGERTLSELGGGSIHEFTIKPSGESDITVRFTDARGNARSHKVGVYIEPPYQGSIDIKLDHLGNIRWKDAVRSCPA